MSVPPRVPTPISTATALEDVVAIAKPDNFQAAHAILKQLFRERRGQNYSQTQLVRELHGPGPTMRWHHATPDRFPSQPKLKKLFLPASNRLCDHQVPYDIASSLVSRINEIGKHLEPNWMPIKLDFLFSFRTLGDKRTPFEAATTFVDEMRTRSPHWECTAESDFDTVIDNFQQADTLLQRCLAAGKKASPEEKQAVRKLAVWMLEYGYLCEPQRIAAGEAVRADVMATNFFATAVDLDDLKDAVRFTYHAGGLGKDRWNLIKHPTTTPALANSAINSFRMAHALSLELDNRRGDTADRFDSANCLLQIAQLKLQAGHPAEALEEITAAHKYYGRPIAYGAFLTHAALRAQGKHQAAASRLLSQTQAIETDETAADSVCCLALRARAVECAVEQLKASPYGNSLARRLYRSRDESLHLLSNPSLEKRDGYLVNFPRLKAVYTQKTPC